MKKLLLAIMAAALWLPQSHAAEDPAWVFTHPKNMNEQLKKDIAEQIPEQAIRDAYQAKLGSYAAQKDGVLEIRNGAVAVTDLPKGGFEVEFDWSHSGSFESTEVRKDPVTKEEKNVTVPWMANLDVLLGHVEIKPIWAFDPIGGPTIRLTFMPSGAIVVSATDQLGKAVGVSMMVIGHKVAKGDVLRVKIVIKNGKMTVTTAKKGDPKSATLVIDTKLIGGQLGFRSREPVGPNLIEEEGKKPYCAYIKNFKMKALP